MPFLHYRCSNAKKIFTNIKSQVDTKRGESSLVIVELFPEDEGEYMCKAENEEGIAITHCHLFVKSEFK